METAMEHKRTNYSSGASLEEKVGYSRMVKIDDQVFIGGTTSVQPDGSVYGETAYEQARYIFDKMMVLLAKVGAGARDVYRVDYFVTDMAIKSLNRPTQLVEIELAALVHTVLE